MTRPLRHLIAGLSGLLLVTVTVSTQGAPSPQAVVDELIAADRAFSAAGSRGNVIAALSAMFADDVAMPLPTGDFAMGKAKAVEALGANPDNAASRVEWAPVRGGVSADGLHGFTVGYMTLHRPDKTRMPLKYLAYWVKGRDGWRVAVYKRGRGAEGPVSRELMPAALPARLVAPSTDTAAIARLKASLDEAERGFSDEAQRIGLGPAFAKHGSADAVNIGGGDSPGFVVSAAAIGRAIGADSPGAESPVTWAPDRGVIVASSGDLGVTLGMIRRNIPPPPGQPAATPFVTIWRRANATEPWRYVAE